nr:hypothetical protein [Tanacetum cinerariifolium]
MDEYVMPKYGNKNLSEDDSWIDIIKDDVYDTFYGDGEEETKVAKANDKRKGKLIEDNGKGNKAEHHHLKVNKDNKGKGKLVEDNRKGKAKESKKAKKARETKKVRDAELAKQEKKASEVELKANEAKKAKGEELKAKKAKEAMMAELKANKAKNAKEAMLAKVVQISSDEDDVEDPTAPNFYKIHSSHCLYFHKIQSSYRIHSHKIQSSHFLYFHKCCRLMLHLIRRSRMIKEHYI